MKYVVDSSAALKWVLPEIDSDKAIRLRDEYRNAVHDLLAVDIPAECGNGLLVAERMGRIPSFANLLADVLTTCPRLQPTIPLIPAHLQSSRQPLRCALHRTCRSRTM